MCVGIYACACLEVRDTEHDGVKEGERERETNTDKKVKEAN